jgi:hypothetical protein
VNLRNFKLDLPAAVCYYLPSVPLQSSFSVPLQATLSCCFRSRLSLCVLRCRFDSEMAAEEGEEPLISAQQQLGRFISVLFYCKYNLLCSSVSDPDWIRIQSGPWIRIRIQEGKNDLQNIKKLIIFMFFCRAECSLWRAEGFSCSMDILYV